MKKILYNKSNFLKRSAYRIFVAIILVLVTILVAYIFKKNVRYKNTLSSIVEQVVLKEKFLRKDISQEPVSSIVESAREQVGVVTKYDVQYYAGGYPPDDRGACSDVIARALRDVGYDLKSKIDIDMKKSPTSYVREYDKNINFRRVVNIEDYFDRKAESLSVTFPQDDDWSDWLPGDIVTYEQIPGSLWHIAIISNYQAQDGTPLIIHNYGRGTTEDNMLKKWPSKLEARYRLTI